MWRVFPDHITYYCMEWYNWTTQIENIFLFIVLIDSSSCTGKNETLSPVTCSLVCRSRGILHKDLQTLVYKYWMLMREIVKTISPKWSWEYYFPRPNLVEGNNIIVSRSLRETVFTISLIKELSIFVLYTDFVLRGKW